MLWKIWMGREKRRIERRDAAYWRKAYESLVAQTGRDLNDGRGVCCRAALKSTAAKEGGEG